MTRVTITINKLDHQYLFGPPPLTSTKANVGQNTWKLEHKTSVLHYVSYREPLIKSKKNIKIKMNIFISLCVTHDYVCDFSNIYNKILLLFSKQII